MWYKVDIAGIPFFLLFSKAGQINIYLKVLI